ncbi:MAG: hypothetical protein ACREIQ_06550 [Nitrospiria bacterium]
MSYLQDIMKQVLIILGSLYVLSLPAEALGKVDPKTTDHGTANYIDSLNKNPPSLVDQFRLITENFTPPIPSWPTLKRWFQFQKYRTAIFLATMSIVERLILGIGLAFFSLATFYVLLFRSSMTRSIPRLLFRLFLILILITTSTLSYFTLIQSLIPQDKGRPDGILQLEQKREKILDQESKP